VQTLVLYLLSRLSNNFGVVLLRSSSEAQSSDVRLHTEDNRTPGRPSANGTSLYDCGKEIIAFGSDVSCSGLDTPLTNASDGLSIIVFRPAEKEHLQLGIESRI